MGFNCRTHGLSILTLALAQVFLPSPVFLPTLPAAEAGTCASHCGPPPLQFEPGQLIQVELVNLTSNLIQVQEAQGSEAIPLYPGRTMRLQRWGNTTVNSSLVFWDTLGLFLDAQVLKPEMNLLRVELYPGYESPGDRSVYLRDDGQVEVF